MSVVLCIIILVLMVLIMSETMGHSYEALEKIPSLIFYPLLISATCGLVALGIWYIFRQNN